MQGALFPVKAPHKKQPHKLLGTRLT